jgi:hypothetical protein
MCFDLTRPSSSRHSRDILDIGDSIRRLLEKVQHATQKAPFDGLLRGRLRAMKRKIKVILDDSDEKSGSAMQTVTQLIMRTDSCLDLNFVNQNIAQTNQMR